MSIPTLEEALDHAYLVGDCVSTSAKALKRLAEEIADLQCTITDLQDRNEQMAEENQWLYGKVDELEMDIQFLEIELKEVSRGLAYYERGDWDE